MKLGINQLAIVKRCYLKGNVGIQDVSLYYPIRLNRRNKNFFYGVFEKLEIRGLLVQSDPYHWVLTDFGKSFVEKNFNFKKESR